MGTIPDYPPPSLPLQGDELLLGFAVGETRALPTREIAALAAMFSLDTGSTFVDVATGLAGTAEGGFFFVPGAGAVFATLYRKVAGAAVALQALPSYSGLLAATGLLSTSSAPGSKASSLPASMFTPAAPTAGWLSVYELGLPSSGALADFNVMLLVQGTNGAGLAAAQQVGFTFVLGNSGTRRNAAAPYAGDAGAIYTNRPIGPNALNVAARVVVNAGGRVMLQVAAAAGTISSVSAQGAYTLLKPGSANERPAIYAPALLGTIAVDNSGGGCAILEDGYPFPVVLAWKAGLTADFGNLRIFDIDGVTPIPFFIDEMDQRTIPGVAAVAWLRLPRLAIGLRTLSYDGGADIRLSAGAAVFSFFDDFRGPAIDTGKWALTVTNGSISTAPRITPVMLWSINRSGAQCFCPTPHGMVVCYHEADDSGKIMLCDPDTGAIIAGPVVTGYHPYLATYVPEQDAVLVSPSATTAGNDFKAWLHKLSDLSLAVLGKLGPIIAGSNPDMIYMRQNRVLSMGSDSTTAREFIVDWNAFSLTAATVHTVDNDVLRAELITQGFAYRQADGTLWHQGNNGALNENGLGQFSLNADGSASQIGHWGHLPVTLAGDVAEMEGMAFDDQGALYYAGAVGATLTIYRAALDTRKGGTAFLRTFRGVAGCAATMRRIAPVTAPTRLLFGIYRVGQPFDSGGAGSMAGFGLCKPDYMPTGYTDDSLMFRRHITAAPEDGNTIYLERQKSGSAALSSTIAAPTSIRLRSTYELKADGTHEQFSQNGALLGNYADTVPNPASGNLYPTIYNAHAANVGLAQSIGFVAEAKLVPAGVTEPTLTAA